MSLSRRARRGISMWNARMKSPRQQRYCSKQMRISVNEMPANILKAAKAAAEAINAIVQIVPDSKENPIAPVAEGRTELSVPVQPKAGEEVAEGTPGGPQ